MPVRLNKGNNTDFVEVKKKISKRGYKNKQNVDEKQK